MGVFCSSGLEFTVSAGWTLLLPCSGSSKFKQRWFRQSGQRKEVIFTRFRDGTEKPERDWKRLSYRNDALQIRNLQPEDAGEYLCNSMLQAKLTVLDGQNLFNFCSCDVIRNLQQNLTKE